MAYPVRQSVRVAAYALVVQDDKLLMCRLNSTMKDAHAWTLPGGGLDFGESPAAGAVREVLEETGLVVRVTDLVSVADDVYDDRLHHIQIIYRADYVSGELRHEVHGSTDMCAWVSLEESRAFRLVPVARLGISLVFGG